jgi:integrase
LFPELRPVGPDLKCSRGALRLLSALKIKLGLPRSVNTHSLRRYAITTLERGGASPIDMARYFGHDLPAPLALQVYSAGPSEAQMVTTAWLLRYSGPIEAAKWELATSPTK